MEDKKFKFRFSYVFLLLALVLLLCLVFSDRGYKGEFLAGGEAEVVELIEGRNKEDGTHEQMVAFYYKDGIGYILVDTKHLNEFPNYSNYYFYYDARGTDGIIERLLLKINATEAEIKVLGPIPEGPSAWDIIYPLLYIGFGLFLVWMVYRMIAGSNKGAMSFGKSKARAYTSNKVRFNDVAGTEEEKEELAEIVEFLKSPKKFTSLGARIPKGILLVGPPGTGKTLLARAVAGEANVPFITISGSDFVEMFVGVGASRVRDLFDQAKKNKPCIVFIDEIDAVGRQRGAGLGGGNDEREQTLNQLLVEMDGFEANEGIIVLAATNRSDILDPALMRPGRFDRQVYVNVPDVKGREGIIKIHSKNKPMDETVDFKTLAKITVGFTGADLENMLNEAAILAARANRPRITMTDITEGINKVTMGPQKKSRLITEKDRKLTAYHEAGHAILGKLLKYCDEIQEVSIIPRGSAGGYTMQRPENDNSFRSYNYLMDEIAMCMGGRIAEEIIFKDVTTGASSDINQATKIAHDMVYRYGMSKDLGFMSLDTSNQVFIGRDYQTKNEFSEKLASQADDEIKQILDYNYKRAKKLLSDNEKLLHEMVKLLFERETIYKEEVDLLMQGKSSEEIVKIITVREKEQKAKEEELRKERAEKDKLDSYKRKVQEGEKLLASGIITQAEYDNIKKEYDEYMNQHSSQQQDNSIVVVESAAKVDLQSKAEGKTKAAQSTTAIPATKTQSKPRTRKTTSKDDKKGEK